MNDTNDSEDQIYELETWELAKCRLHNLKKSFEEYLSLYERYLRQHYVTVALCGVVILFGVIIVILKFEGKENLLFSFKAIQSGFASIVSGGSIMAFAGKILIVNNKEESDDKAKDSFKDETIRLCVERDLGEKIDKMAKNLRKKKKVLEEARAALSIWSILASIVVLILVGIDFFGFLPDIPYIDVGLDFFLSLTGMYYLGCTWNLYALITTPRYKLEKSRLVVFFFVAPCAACTGLLCYENEHWLKDVHLSRNESAEVEYLLRGLNPEISHTRIKKFCKELDPADETTPLKGKPKSELVELVNKIESEAKQKVLKIYFELGKALYYNWLEKQINPDVKMTFTNEMKNISEIVEKFSLIQSDLKEIRTQYFEFLKSSRGITLAEFFEKSASPKDLLVEEINAAHNALKVYSIFNGIKKINGVERNPHEVIGLIKTFSASSIGEFTRREIFDIIQMINKNSINIKIEYETN